MKLLLLLILTFPLVIHAKCGFIDKVEQKEDFKLSNGVWVHTPTKASEVETFSIFGTLDLAKAESQLSPHHLFPVTVAGKAIGALSLYKYNKSDLGNFDEVYFVTFAAKDKLSNFDNIIEFFKALRWNPTNNGSQILLFHLEAYSGSQNGYLASNELWKIPAERAIILSGKIGANLPPNFSLNSKIGRPILLFTQKPGTWLKNPVGLNFKILATGKKIENKSFQSPVWACGSTKFSSFNEERFNLKFFPGALADLSSYLKFTPFHIEWGQNIKAVQFPPME